MAHIKVAVSPFYGGEGWTDEKTGITFQKDKSGFMSTYIIPEGADLSGIRKAIQLNALILLEGTIEDSGTAKEKEESKTEVKEEVKIEEEKKEEKKTPASSNPKRKSSNKK